MNKQQIPTTEKNSSNTEDSKIIHYRELLNASTEQMSPAVKANLNAARNRALEAQDDKSWFDFSALMKPSFSFALVILTIVSLVFMQNPINPSIDSTHQLLETETETDIFADLELLMDEESLEFLTDLELDNWAEFDS